MKQILQDLSSGSTLLVDVPRPVTPSAGVLVRTHTSLISAGTERMLVGFGRAGWVSKARQQPDKVREVFNKARTDGVLATVEAVRSKLEQPIPLGYSNVGVVEGVGEKVSEFSVGDRVVSNGPHAEYVTVGQNLCAKVPEEVSDEEASFTVLGATALQGIRLSRPALGECFVVIGLGVIGLIAVQLLRANGCRVLGIDPDPHKTALGRHFGAETVESGQNEDAVATAHAFSRGRGVDGAIVAAATKSSAPMNQAAQMCRQRGRVIQVGVTGLELERELVFRKELVIQVSNSTGPGKGDPLYEEQGYDYPIGFVRWTTQRNFEAVLDMMAAGKIDVAPLVSHRFRFEDAPKAYDLLSEGKSSLGILLEYSTGSDVRYARRMQLGTTPFVGKDAPVVGFIGAGNYASRVLVPAFKAAGAGMHTIVSAGGTSSVIHGKKAGFTYASTDVEGMLGCKVINTVAVATRHDSHAGFVVQALKAGKHVFVEKPMCLNLTELDEVKDNYENKRLMLMVGFNRRFAPQVQKMKSLLGSVKEPKSFIMTMNAGAIPGDHWVQDPQAGGGRIIGEACHYIDLMRFLAGSKIVSVQAMCMGDAPGLDVTEDKAAVMLSFADGSFGTIHYLANGHAGFPKERLEVFAGGRVLQLDNFRRLKGFGWPGFKKMNLWRQDKGQKACAAAFVEAVKQGGPAPIAAEEIFEVAEVSIKAAKKIRN